MKLVIILLSIIIILLGINFWKDNNPLEFYPEGDSGDRVPYKYAPMGIKCDLCGENEPLFKHDNRGRIVCSECYKKIKYKRFK